MSTKPRRASSSVPSSLRAAGSLAAAALIGPILALRATYPNFEILIWVGVAVLIVIALALQISKVVADMRRDTESANFRVQLRDALLPVTGLVAEMDVAASSAVRLEQIKTAAFSPVGGLCQLIEPHSKRVRANVFWIDDDTLDLVCLAHAGRGERPGKFVRGTARGEAVFEYLVTLKPEFYPDLKKEKPTGFQGTMENYQTFISVPIWANNKVFGMITVDSPKQNSLVLEDQFVVEMFAELMSIAFERGLHESESNPSNVATVA